MSIQVNSKGKSFGNSLIKSGKIDSTSGWGFSGADGNKLLGPDGNDWTNFAKHHLAEDTEQSEDTKTRWKYPFAKMKGDESVIFRRGVIAAKSRAAQQGQTAISNAADDLLQAIDAKLEKDGIDIDELNEKLTEEEKDLCGINKKKKKTKDSEYENLEEGLSRVDFMYEDLMTERFTETPEGFLSGRAVITNVGVFSYLTKDKTVVRELRLPEEVFSIDSLNSLRMSPLTNNHPDEMVNSENVKDYQVGFVGDSLMTDSYHVSGPITITDRSAVSDVRDKRKRSLSAGYTVDLEKKSGVWIGVPYDAIQRNIRYNHVAIVDRGRAGDAAVMKLDSIDGIHQVSQKNPFNIDNNFNKVSGKEELMKTVKIDGVDYQAEARVIEELNKTQKKNDEFSTEVGKLQEDSQKLQAKYDSLVDENKQLKADKENLEKQNPKKLDQAIQEKLELLKTAELAGVEIKDGESNLDIKKKVILKAYPNNDELSKKLDEAEVAYIDARFDAAVEFIKDSGKVSEENKKKVADNTSKNDNSEKSARTPDQARQDMIDRMKNAWKDEEK